jgi:tricorn protease
MFSQLLTAQGTRLLRQPDMSDDAVVFVYGSDVWTADKNGENVRRITSTPAIESNPHFSPDGSMIAFTSNRGGSNAVYVVEAKGGIPTRLTWHPSSATVRGWTNDGKSVLFASTRETAPVSYNRLWTVPVEGGPAELVSHQWGFDGSYSGNGKRLALDKMSRWDVEWRAYRGGQNTPLIILDLATQEETLLPNEKTTDIQPTWMGDEVFFLSDRDWTMNVWAYNVRSGDLRKVTNFRDTDAKWLSAHDGQLIVEQNGYLHTVEPGSGQVNQLNITVIGDFPWAETKWEDVSSRAGSVSLSPTGKRALMAARGDIFTVPIEYGDARNLTASSGAADRAPLWSPKGDQIAWFSDAGGNGYALYLNDQDGRGTPRALSIGASKMAWDPAWSPDGKHIAFTDDDVRIRVINIETGDLKDRRYRRYQPGPWRYQLNLVAGLPLPGLR